MDDGGRCLLDVINDPQLLQSFLETSNNNGAPQTNSDSSTISSGVVAKPDASAASNSVSHSSNFLIESSSSTTTTLSSNSNIDSQQLPPPISSTSNSIPNAINDNKRENDSASTSINSNDNNTVFAANSTNSTTTLSSPAISAITSTTTAMTITQPDFKQSNNAITNLSNNQMITIPGAIASPVTIKNNNPATLSAVTTTNIATTPKPVRAKKSTTKSMKNQTVNMITAPTTISSLSGIIGSSVAATSIPSNTIVAAASTPFLNSTALMPLTSIANANGVQTLNFAGSQLPTNVVNATSNIQTIRHSSAPTTAFVSAPQFQLGPRPMAMLPQSFILPGSLQLSNGSNNSTSPQFVITKPQHPSGGSQLLQIIQTSQGPQLIAQGAPAPQSIQTLATPNNIHGINVQSQAATLAKNSKGSNKQILPKPYSGSSKNSKINSNQINTSQNIKFIQTSTAVNSNPTQFIIGGTNQTAAGSHNRPQLIAGPNGTFFLSNSGTTTQFATQPQLLLPNQQLLAIRPTGPGSLTGQTLLVNSNALTAAANTTNDQGTLNQLTIPPASPIINSSKSSNMNHILLNRNASAAPIVSQSTGLTTIRAGQSSASGNLIIRPQIIGHTIPSSTPAATNNATPQLIQLQTPNGPILLSVNLNSSQQTQQQQQPSPAPQTVQIGNTLFSLTTNAVNQAPHPLNIGVGNSSAPLSQTILSNQTQQQLTQNLSSQIHQQHQIFSSSNINQKNQASTKPKTPNMTKKLNLTDLLKETGILTDFSPPTSPVPSTQVKDVGATVLVDQSNTSSLINAPTSQSQTVLMVSNPANTNLFLTQQQQVQQQNKSPIQTATTATTLVPPSQAQTQQLRISLTPDGTLVLLSPNSNVVLPTTQPQNSGQTKNNIAQVNNSNKEQQTNDPSGLGSSQPSPDSTTPSIDTGSCSSPSVVTSTPAQSFTTQSVKNSSSIDSCQTKSENTIDDSVVSSLSSANVSMNSSLKTSTTIVSSSIIPSTLSTCAADTSSIKPSQQQQITTNAPLILSQPTTIPVLTSNQPTFTTVLIPGTIMFLNDKRIPIATVNRTNQIAELMQRLDNKIKENIGQQKDLQSELQNLRQALTIIQSQPLIPNQIPQIKISDKVAQAIQISSWSNQTTQIRTNTPTIALVNHQSINVTSTTTTTMTTASSTMSTVTNNVPTAVKFVIETNIDSNSIQLVHEIPNSSPMITQPPPSLSSSSSQTSSIDMAASQKHSQQQDTQTPPPPQMATSTVVMVKEEKPKPNPILKAIQSQLHVDQNAALNPDFRTPFRSRDDACKRLLRYHVFDEQQFSEKQIQKFDELYEKASQLLLYKKRKLYDKFRYLLIKNSMKSSPSCEHVMVNRMIIDEETASLKSDKELISSGGVLNLPPLPESWLETQLHQQNISQNDNENDEPKQSLIDANEFMNFDYFNANNNIINDNYENSKRKYEDDDSTTTDFLLESASNTNLFLNSSELSTNDDLKALCDIFDDESIQSMKNSIDNVNFDENDVDKLIKLDANNSNNFLEIDGLDDQNDSNNLLKCNQNLEHTSATTIDDDLEAIYSNITETNDLLSNNNQNALIWPNNSVNNNQSNILDSTNNLMSLSNHDDHFLGRSTSTSGTSLSWTTRTVYGNVNETEAAVAVQSIIGADNNEVNIPTDDNNDSMDFSSLDLPDSCNTSTTVSIPNFSNDHSFQRGKESTSINDDNLSTSSTSAADLQINCAIKSIMMTSDDNQYNNNLTSINNDLMYQQQQNHHHMQQSTSMILPTSSTISTSSMMMGNHYSSSSTSMMMNSFSGASTLSHINDPMLDEAVKSIL